MKISRLQRTLSFLFSLILALGVFGAKAESGLDSALASWLEREDAYRFSMTMELTTFLPFEKETLQMMNKLLAHTSFQSSIEHDGEGGMTTLQISVDSEALFSFTEREQEGAYSLETTLLPNRLLQSAGVSPLSLLGFEVAGEEATASFDMLTALAEVEGCYQALVDACEPYAEKKRANYKIKDIGSAKWSQIARLTTEQSDAMLPQLRAVLKSGMDEGYRAELDQVRFQKGFVVALYKTGENDKDIALYMKGSLLYPDGSTRRLAYQWAFVNNGTERKDSYKYEIVKDAKPADNRTIGGLLTRKLFSDQILYKGSYDVSLKQDKVTTAHAQKLNLTGKTVEGARTLEGSLSQQTKVTDGDGSVTQLYTLTPNLTITPEGSGAILSGTAKVEQKTDKTVQSAITFTFAEEIPETLAADRSMYEVLGDDQEPAAKSPPPPSSIQQNADEVFADESAAAGSTGKNDYLVGDAPIGMKAHTAPSQATTISLDGISQAQLDSLTEELMQNLAARLLVAFARLPEEDIAFLRDGMTDDDFSRFLSLVGGV